jgi:glycosyltransferase involved in cell wall biosynthesis
MSKLATGFSSRGWCVQVVSMLPVGDSLLRAELERGDVRVASLDMNPGAPNPFAISKLARLVRDFSTDVLHSHMVKANILARLARRGSRVPVQISTAHNTIEGGRWVQWAYRLTDSFADLTTNVSQKAVDRYIKIGAVPGSRIRLVRNGLDMGPFGEDPDARSRIRDELGIESSFTWLAVGRLTVQKDYANLLDAFQQVLERHDAGARLLIVGKGPLRHEIEQKIHESNLESAVQLLGERQDVPQLMHAADGYAMSSAWEGAPVVLLEAAASRLPIVATDVGGNRELVIEGETALLVPANNSGALADALLRIMALSPDQRHAMGEAGRTLTEREFNLEIILDQWEALYEELLSQKKRPA